MSKTILRLASVLILVCTASSVEAQQVSKFADLEKHLEQETVGPDAIRIILAHLNTSGTNAPLDALVAWAKAGFPDQHENGIWKTDYLGLRLGIVRALYFYLSRLPQDVKSARYLNVLDELESDYYIIFQLGGVAHRVVDEAVLEERVLKLLQEKDPKLRERGAWMGQALAKQKRDLFERYHQMVKNDDDVRVRKTTLTLMVAWRTREVAFIALERLLNDQDPDVRETGAKLLRISADRGILTADDLGAMLRPMLATNNGFVHASIASAAAQVATADGSLRVRSGQITADLVSNFIKNARTLSPTEAELAKLWLNWWTPLIPEFTVRLRPAH